MNIAFIDPLEWDYDAGSPYDRPLGGSQSALCYLAVSLAARGHAVTMYTGTTKPRVFDGVQCRSVKQFTKSALAAAGLDALIALTPAQDSLTLKPLLSPRCPLILWTGHSYDQPAMFALKQTDVRAGWDRIACVSQWHAASMQQHYGLDPQRVAVLRNAISPAFANLFPDAAALASAKSSMSELAYTSTPFRGLNILASVFPVMHSQNALLRLRVYSSMKVYNVDESKDAYGHIYARCRSTPGIEFVGSLPQPALATALKSAMILAYPNTFEETSCIAVMEAMAAGLLVVTSDLGALPETTMGRAVLVPGRQDISDRARFAQAYYDELVATLRLIGTNPQQFWLSRWDQVQAVNAQYTWAVRAAEWEHLLLSMR